MCPLLLISPVDGGEEPVTTKLKTEDFLKILTVTYVIDRSDYLGLSRMTNLHSEIWMNYLGISWIIFYLVYVVLLSNYSRSLKLHWTNARLIFNDYWDRARDVKIARLLNFVPFRVNLVEAIVNVNSSQCKYLKYSIINAQHTDIEGAPAQIIDEDVPLSVTALV